MRIAILQSTNFRKFGAEYLMIVISILTALALEDFAQDLSRRGLANQASIKIDAEIEANIVELDKVITHNQSQAFKMEAMRKNLLADIKKDMGETALRERILSNYQDAFDLSIRSPSLRREAWEVAVANQSVSWMPGKELNRYSIIYASMRDLQAVHSGMNNYFLDGPQMMNVGSDAQMGVVAPRDVYRMINQIINSYQSINGNLRNLRAELATAAAANPASKNKAKPS